MVKLFTDICKRSLILVVLFSCSLSISATDDSCLKHPAMSEVKQTVDKILKELESNKAKIKEKPKTVYGIINRLLVPKADFEIMSRLVLTRNWKKLNSKQKKDFTTEFSRLMIRTYGVAFESYDGETVDYTCPFRKLPKSGGAQRLEVATTIHSPNRPDSIVKFRILEQNKVCNKCQESITFCKKMAGSCKDLQQDYTSLKTKISETSDSQVKTKLEQKLAKVSEDYDFCKRDYDDCKNVVTNCKQDCEKCQSCTTSEGDCSKCTNEWLVYDLIIDNVSIINSYRQIFKDKFRKESDPNKIIADMHEKNCKDKVFCV